MTTRPHRLLAAVLAAALAVAACGDDGDDEASAEGDATATTEEAAQGEAGDEPATTEAPAEGGGDAAADEDEAAAGDVVATVFDSALPFEDKAALIEGGEAHRADHEAYVGAAQAVGGIAVEPTDVAVAGDTATVTYRVLFAGAEAYADLSMDVTRADDAWIVPTDAFCGFLASAQVPCAAPAGG